MKKNGLLLVVFFFYLNVVLGQENKPTFDIKEKFVLKSQVKTTLDRKDKRDDFDSYISKKNALEYIKNLERWYDNQLNLKQDSISDLETRVNDLEPNRIDEVLSKIPYNKIDKLQFATKPLDEKLVIELFKAAEKEIEFAGTEWETFDKERRAGYARHSLDGNGVQGVFLNEKAVNDLLEILEKSMLWRFPTLNDIMGINNELSRKKLSAFDVLAADDFKNKDNRIKWKKPGKDYYGMGLLPCGYKSGELEYPKPNMPQSSNFAIYSSEKEIDFVTNIGMVDLNEGASQLDYMVYPVDEAAFGVYVILFRKEK